MTRHPIDIVLILLRAQLGHTDQSLTAADKSRLMEVVQVAGQHAVGPALYRGLQAILESGEADGWQTVAPMLKVLEDHNASRNRQVRELCLRMNKTLAGAGIQPAFLKGAAFIVEDPDAAPWRFVSDIDILVDEPSLDAAANALVHSGFELAGSPEQYRSSRHHHYAPLFDRQTGLSVELHRRLLREATLDRKLLEQTASRFATSRVDGQNISMLNPAERLAHLVWHAQAGNLGYPLRQISLRDMLDAATLMHAAGPRLKDVRERASQAGMANQFDGFLLVANRLLEVSRFEQGSEHGALAWASAAIDRLSEPPGQQRRTFELSLHYLKTAIKNPSRLMNGLRALMDQGLVSHAGRILKRRVGKQE